MIDSFTVEAEAAVLVLETPLLVPAAEVVVLVAGPLAAVVRRQVLAVVGELVGREVEAAGAVARAADVPAVALAVVLAVALEQVGNEIMRYRYLFIITDTDLPHPPRKVCQKSRPLHTWDK